MEDDLEDLERQGEEGVVAREAPVQWFSSLVQFLCMEGSVKP